MPEHVPGRVDPLTSTAETDPRHGAGARGRSAAGIWLALFSAASFGTSGSFGKSLLDAGWSPGAAVTARIGGAALIMAVPAAIKSRGRWHLLRRHAGLLAVYGVVAMAGCQLFFFNAVTRLSVGVALLLEYLAPVLIIGWLWMRSGVRPSRLTLIGAAVSIGGLVLVLDVTGAVDVDLVGVAWGLAAALGLVVYFLLSAREPEGLPPFLMASAGMVIATAVLLVVGVLGVMPFDASTEDVEFVGREVSWLVPVVAMVVIATALAYTSGIAAVRALGSRLSSFIGLTEVLFAVLFAWLILGELPRPIQLVGGLLIVAGVSCVRYDELLVSRSDPSPGATLPPPEGHAEMA